MSLSNNILITDHEQKASFIYESFRNRLGVSEFTDIIFDLTSFIEPQQLDGIDSEFSPDEIDKVIKLLPNNHAPGLMVLMVCS